MLVAYTLDDLQEALYRDLGLVVNTNKTEVMFQWGGERPLVDLIMKIYEAELRTVTQFTHLGRILSTDCKPFTLYRRHLKQLDRFLMQCLKKTL